MLCIMRTTVSVSDELLIAALRREPAVPAPRGAHPAVPVFRGGTGPRPGIDLTSGSALHEALDEHTDLGQRR